MLGPYYEGIFCGTSVGVPLEGSTGTCLLSLLLHTLLFLVAIVPRYLGLEQHPVGVILRLHEYSCFILEFLLVLLVEAQAHHGACRGSHNAKVARRIMARA